jgi:hypothetical protein
MTGTRFRYRRKSLPPLSFREYNAFGKKRAGNQAVALEQGHPIRKPLRNEHF